ncbi:hypothetical protein AcW1_001972 [Taiwanofungus camphoratus]|nr:hypothetical protein AcW1_001972 [Antrodia cinnamomea]
MIALFLLSDHTHLLGPPITHASPSCIWKASMNRFSKRISMAQSIATGGTPTPRPTAVFVKEVVSQTHIGCSPSVYSVRSVRDPTLISHNFTRSSRLRRIWVTPSDSFRVLLRISITASASVFG